jgi:hypothetical protein
MRSTTTLECIVVTCAVTERPHQAWETTPNTFSYSMVFVDDLQHLATLRMEAILLITGV